MKKLYGRCRFMWIIVWAGLASAAPLITVDNAVYDAGFLKTTARSVRHQFTITNKGDQKLMIKNVRAGCGCTIVDYDSVIAPGKSGHVTQKVNIGAHWSGSFEKSITVFSNAENNPELKFTVKGNIRAIISISATYVSLKDQSPQPFELTLSTQKSDLKIKNAYFKESSPKSSDFGLDLPFLLSHRLVTSPKVGNDGDYVYKLLLSSNCGLTENKFGKITIETNHPQKPEIVLSGHLQVPDPAKSEQ